MVHGWIMSGYLNAADTTNPAEREAMQAELMRTALGAHADEADAAELHAIGAQPALTPYLALTAISLGTAVRLKAFTDQERIAIDDSLHAVTVSLGKSESLLRTPIPLGYTRSSVRFLWIWLTLLPFALCRTFSEFGVNTWWEDKPQPVLVLAMFFISFTFLSIEDIAVQIEEPFAILPLDLHHKWLKWDVSQMKQLVRWSSARKGEVSAKS
eukprot:4395199-Prymnesium_polylepis.1